MKNFLKVAAHQHKDPQVRLGFINDLDSSSESAQSTLCEMALADADLHVRLAAIERIDELTALRALLDANGDNAQALADAAENRLVEKFSKGELSDIAVRALLTSHAGRLAVPLAVSGIVAEQRELAMPHLQDEASLLTVVQQTRFHDTRMAAATRLSQHDSLRSALSAMRSKDKLVAKHLQQTLDDMAAAEADLIARRHAVNTCLKSMQDLCAGVWTPQHAGKLRALKDTWASFDSKDVCEHQQAYDLALNDAEKQLAEYQARSQQTAESAGIEQATSDLDTAPDSLSAAESVDNTSSESNNAKAVDDGTIGSSAATPPSVDLPEVKALLAELLPVDLASLARSIETIRERSGSDESITGQPAVKEQTDKLLAHGTAIAVLFDPPYDLQKARPAALQQRIDRVAALLDIQSILPGLDLTAHTYYKELGEHHIALQDRLGKAKQESADRIKATHRQFAALNAIIKEGKWGPANSMLRRLSKKLSGMETAERSSLNEKLERAERQLNEMADWQDFAARPKLEALCEQMEALPAKELEAEALARQVRELQKAWKALGVSRASNELWTRFKSAGDTAYEPCKSWFEDKQKERQKKLDAKSALCEKLETDAGRLSDNPDWKAIARTVNQAKREWSRNRVPDRKPDKELEARFSAALQPFESGLAEQYDANAAEKKALIEKVAALADAEITQHSANQAKRLLNAWKLVGVMRRKEDQALWEEFNTHLGTIFKHQHKVAREKQRAELGHVYRAREIIKELKQLAKGDSLDESRLQALSTEFQALPEFPERDKKFLIRDYRQSLDACSRLQDSASRRKAQAEVDEKNRLIVLCEQLEQMIEKPDTISDAQIEDITHAWEATETRLSHELAGALLNRRDNALTHLKQKTQPDFDANETARRDLLIRMEIAAGLDTPSEDRSRRMAYQLQHLQEGMTSSGIEDSKHVLARLDREWAASGPVRMAVRESLHSRYLKVFER